MESLSFREFIKLKELADPMANPATAATANAVRTKMRSLVTSPQGQKMDADDLVNTAAKDVALQPGTGSQSNPLAIAKLAKPLKRTPGAPTMGSNPIAGNMHKK